MKWREMPFEDLYQVPSRNGVTRPSRVRGAGFKMINMGELFAHDRIGDIEMERVQLTERELDSMLVEPGDLLFARQSLVLSGAGKCSIVVAASEPTTFESHLIRIRLRRALADPLFFYYYFKSPTAALRSIVTQGVQAGIRGNDLKRLNVCVPALGVQARIAETLRNYDDLIENNRRRLALLEESARLLYREWFVHFRFPGHEHVEIVDGVPNGWSLQNFGQIAELRYGKALKREDRGDGSVPVYGSSGVVGTHAAAIAEGPALIVGRKGNVGSVFWSWCDFWPIDTVYFVPTEQSDFWLYLTLPTAGFLNTDAGVPGLNRDFAYSRVLKVPAEAVRRQFNELVAPVFDQMRVLDAYCGKLAQARDLLLPRLISGEITV